MFGCYRRTEAADPGTYVAAIALVLTHYPIAVVDAVTDPFGGLPARKTESGWSGLPDVADVKEACENEAARRIRMANYRAMGKTEFKRLAAPRDNSPGVFATILVHPHDPRHAKFLKHTETADPRDWKQDERGLWVCWTWIDPDKAGEPQRFMQYTEADLRRMYPPRAASDSERSHMKHTEAGEYDLAEAGA